jgi:hypothetical protein
MKKMLTALHDRFNMRTTGLLTRLGDETSILGRTLIRTEKGYLLRSDTKLLESVVRELGLDNVKPATTPGIKEGTDPPSKPLSPEEHSRYRTLVGRLLYLSLDRADVQFAVKELSRHLQNPTELSWGKLKRLGRYLKGYPSSSLGFELTSSPETMNRWVDADWGDKGLMRGAHLEA